MREREEERGQARAGSEKTGSSQAMNVLMKCLETLHPGQETRT